MKTIYLFVLLVVIGHSSIAQDWQCMQPGKKVYFTNAAGYLRGMRVDSSKIVGATTEYYPFHTPRGTYRDAGNHSLPLNTNGGSWLGSKIIAGNDGIAFFENTYRDTVIIHALASLGSSWTFYRDTTAVSYVATVSLLDTMTIDNSLDSVKTITLEAMLGLQPIPGDSISQYQLLLSKNHGFVRVFDFYNFPYHAPGSGQQGNLDYYSDIVNPSGPASSTGLFNRVSFRNPLNEELYDYSAGDLLQYTGTYSSRPYSSHTLRIDSRQENNSQVVYSIFQKDVEFMTNTNLPHYVVSQQTVPLVINKGPMIFIDTLQMPEETGAENLHYFIPWGSRNCTTTAIYKRASNFIIGNIVNTFEPCGTQEEYQTGFGKISYYHCIDPSGIGEAKVLSYSVKNGIPCGIYNSLAIEPVYKNFSMNIYPNPAHNQVFINGKEGQFMNVVLHNLQGQRIMEISGAMAVLKLDISGVAAGTYLLEMSTANEKQSRLMNIE